MRWIKTERVFIVDDERALQFIYSELLKIGGFEVAGIAENGEQAVSMFKSFSEKPKVILMDNRMPRKTGLEATKEILEIEVNVKIIFVSADNSIKEEALSIGAFSFWEKPFEIDELLEHIKKAIVSYDSALSN
jgi:two-component system chemotaxis response regulator CheY